MQLVLAAAAHHPEQRVRGVVAKLAGEERALDVQHLQAPAKCGAAALAVQVLGLDKALARGPASTGFRALGLHTEHRASAHTDQVLGMMKALVRGPAAIGFRAAGLQAGGEELDPRIQKPGVRVCGELC